MNSNIEIKDVYREFADSIDKNFVYIVIIVNVLILSSQLVYEVSHDICINSQSYATSISSIAFSQVFPIVLISPLLTFLRNDSNPSFEFYASTFRIIYLSFKWGVAIVLINAILLTTTIHSKQFAIYISLFSLMLSWLYFVLIRITKEKEIKKIKNDKIKKSRF
jgi:hypothetical protein